MNKYLFYTVLLFAFSCAKNKNIEELLIISDNNPDIKALAADQKAKTPIKLAVGLKIDLWASDTLAPDPIAMSIDDDGSVYLTRTNRQKNSEFDIRGHQNWMTSSIALQSVEDRRNFLKKTFSSDKTIENSWLKDLNYDGVHDWKDLAVEQEEVWKIQDTNKDGYADLSTRIFSGFNDEITDVAGALLVRENDMFIGVGPDFWRLTGKNKRGEYSKKESISHGYAVHIGFGGHGMSGAIEGPDGRIYWGIGDIGANLTAKDGKKYEYPNEGVIVRSNPDGSNFEVFASGLRNTHEFVFDKYGNIISSDNDGDHPGESERLVHIVEGSDAGWRSNWQYGKYTDPKNNKYKVWMDENLFKPRWEGQAAYIIPPIMNFHNGPTGMQFNPGTALGKAWLDKFFLVEFVGNPSRSHIWSFGLKNKGASFVLDGEKDMISGILPTGIKFGPDGALYAADWINGWDTKNYGRVWKIDVDDDNNDLLKQRAETQRLIQLKYSLQTEKMLEELLANDDMRVRQKAQFELVSRGKKGKDVFYNMVTGNKNQLARIHAVWGIGQLARNNSSEAGGLLALLDDKDTELVTQVVKTLGDLKYKDAAAQIVKFLKFDDPRLKFYAAEALGRMEYREAISEVVDMLKLNNDDDLYLRHAGVLALTRMDADNEMLNLFQNKSKALRTAAVLVLRRLKSPKVAVYLEDKDEYIVAEVARAINDDLSIPEALPALAGCLAEQRFKSEPLLRRAINAALRVGDDASMQKLINFAKRSDVSDELRAEAMATLGTWAEPSVLDRVDGRYRGVVKRDMAHTKDILFPHIPSLLNDKNPSAVIAMSQMLSNLQISDFNEKLAEAFDKNKDAKVKIALVNALSDLNYEKNEKVLKSAMESSDADIRTAAIGALSKIEMDASKLESVVRPIITKGTIKEKQKLLSVLGKMSKISTKSIFSELIDNYSAGKLENELVLELSESVNQSGSQDLIDKLAASSKTTNWLDEYKSVMFGGNAWEGRKYFNTNSTGQCVRCHSIKAGTGGAVGPILDGIGSKLTREILLEALVNPSARLSPGYGQVSLELKDGQKVFGTLTAENEHELILSTSDAEPLKIAVSRIAKRENSMSSMTPMGSIMSKREMRDVLEFLVSLK